MMLLILQQIPATLLLVRIADSRPMLDLVHTVDSHRTVDFVRITTSIRTLPRKSTIYFTTMVPSI